MRIVQTMRRTQRRKDHKTTINRQIIKCSTQFDMDEKCVWSSLNQWAQGSSPWRCTSYKDRRCVEKCVCGLFCLPCGSWNGQVLVNFSAERISLTCDQSSGCRRSRVTNSASSAVSGLSSSCTLSMPMPPFAVQST